MVTIKVPTIDKRKRIPQKAIDQVVEQIVEKFKPQKIILFGSYARGNPRPESDVDLIVHTPKRLKERVDMGGWFLRDVLKEGKVLYEASRR
jgi:predicted nucleotidyltransferase